MSSSKSPQSTASPSRNKASAPQLAVYLDHLRGGGVQVVATTIASFLAREGVTVSLLVGDAAGPLRERLDPAIHLVDLLPASRWRATTLALRADPRGLARIAPGLLLGGSPTLAQLPALSAYLGHARPRVLLTATPFMNVEALLARQLASVPTRVVVSEHNDLTPEHPLGRGPVGRSLPLLLAHLYPRAHAVVAVSEGVARDLVRRTGLARSAITRIYNPITHPGIPERARETPDHPWLAPGAPPLILGAGRLTAAKDFPTLIRAVARLRRDRPVNLLILGEGRNPKKHAREQARLRELAAELGMAGALDLPGFVQNPHAYMARASAFALSSRYEGFGNVLVEAMACGCPVVSTDCRSGPAEILDGGRFGPLVPVGDPEALADGIRRVLDAPPPRERLQARAAAFSVARALGAYRALLLHGH